jgi:hypothetical protein
MTWGSLVDCLITSPEDFDAQFSVSPFDSFRTKEAKEWKAAKIKSGVDIVTDDLIEQAKIAADVLKNIHPVSKEIIAKSKKQVVLMKRIKHPASENAINLKALLDFAPEGVDYLADLKTTADFSPSGFSKTIGKYGYHVQASHYLSMWNMLNPDDQRTRFKIVWQDSKPPYEVAVTEIPESDIADGADIFNYLLGKIIMAGDSDEWPMKFKKTVLLGRAMFSVYDEGQEIDGLHSSPKIVPATQDELDEPDEPEPEPEPVAEVAEDPNPCQYRGPVKVLAVDKDHGTKKNGQKWTRYRVHMDYNGASVTATTFSTRVGADAEALIDMIAIADFDRVDQGLKLLECQPEQSPTKPTK